MTATADLRSKVDLFRLFLRERREPGPFYERLADLAIDKFPFPLAGATVLDLGCGEGQFDRVLRERGAVVLATDLNLDGLQQATDERERAFLADGRRLPLASSSVDGVFCSNVLEHTPSPLAIIDEIERVLRPGGWAYVSWTNWLSPWGGHAIAPLHYLGPERGLRAWRRLFGEPTGRNLPGENLWVTFIGTILRDVRSRPGLELVSTHPRYYPSQRWLLAVPGLREVATWNCVLLLQRRR